MAEHVVEAMAWNIEDGLSKGARIPGILKAISHRNPDLVSFSEAYDSDEGIHDGVLDDFERSGYRVVRAAYNDDDHRLDAHGIMAVVRPELLAADPSVIRIAGRAALRLPLTTTTGRLDWYAVHLFDRYDKKPSESARVNQARDLFTRLDSKRAVGVAGDFNALDDSLRARMVHASGTISKYIPSGEPGTAEYAGIRKVGSLSQRLASMATGDVIKEFKSNGFANVDQKHRTPTMPSSHPIADLDHMMVRRARATHFHVHDHVVHNGEPVSDHRAISARIRVLPSAS